MEKNNTEQKDDLKAIELWKLISGKLCHDWFSWLVEYNQCKKIFKYMLPSQYIYMASRGNHPRCNEFILLENYLGATQVVDWSSPTLKNQL